MVREIISRADNRFENGMLSSTDYKVVKIVILNINKIVRGRYKVLRGMLYSTDNSTVRGTLSRTDTKSVRGILSRTDNKMVR